MREMITFDDVYILPRYSEVNSRKDVNISTKFTRNTNLDIPFIASPMDTVCEVNMALALREIGGMGIFHRFCSFSDRIKMVKKYRTEADDKIHGIMYPGYVATSVSVHDEIDFVKLILSAGANILLIDVAHGHHKHVKEFMKKLNSLKNEYMFDIIAGSIATSQSAIDLQEWGADALRVGIGGGSVCETRIRTGIGVPQLQSIIDVCEVADVPVIADGGIRTPSDAAKALAAGADTIMCGSLFAGTSESPGEVLIEGKWPNQRKMKVYRGLASATTKMKYSGSSTYVEGATKIIPMKGSVIDIVNDLCDGIKSSMSYVGAKNLEEFRSKAEFVRVTNAGLIEAHPHLL